MVDFSNRGNSTIMESAEKCSEYHALKDLVGKEVIYELVGFYTHNTKYGKQGVLCVKDGDKYIGINTSGWVVDELIADFKAAECSIDDYCKGYKLVGATEYTTKAGNKTYSPIIRN